MNKGLFVAASIAAVIAAMPAQAQEAGAIEAAGEIVVTAQKRVQNVQDVPISIAVVSGEELQEQGSASLVDYAGYVPGMNVSNGGTPGQTTITLRGVAPLNASQTVGIYLDDAPVGSSALYNRAGSFTIDLMPYDLERIEVLKGPQGTLYGASSIGGLVKYVTVQPDTSAFKVRAGVEGFTIKDAGSLGWGGQVYANAPIITDTLAISGSFAWRKTPGWVDSVNNAGLKDQNDYEQRGGRAALLWQPTPELSIKLAGIWQSLDSDGNGLYAADLDGNRLGNGHSFNNYVPESYDIDLDYYSATIDYDFGAATLTSITAYRDYKNAQGQDSDFSALDILRRTDLDRRFRLFTQELRLQGEAFDGRLDWLVGGYYANEKLDVDDDIVYGADYQRYANCLAAAALSPANLNPASATCSNLPAAAFPGFQGIAALLGAAPLNGTGNNGSTFAQRSTNYAIFTHNSFDIVEDALTLTVGARYTHEKKTLSGDANFTNTLCPAIVNSSLQALATLACVINGTAPDIVAGAPGTKFSEGQWTGTAVLSWKPAPEWLVYASASKGYKAGGFNLDYSALDRPCSTTAGSDAQDAACVALLARPANTPGNARPEASDLQFASEKVDAYELGVKWDGPGVDVNLAAFYQEYSNYQLNTFNGVNFEVTNIQACKDDLGTGPIDNSAATGACASDRLKPGVVAKGFEIETFLRPARYLSVNMGLTYVDTLYRRNLVGTGGRALSPVLFQLPGRGVSNAAKYVATAGISWTPPIGDSGLSALVYFDTRLQSDTNTGSDLDVEKIQDGFAVFNGRIGLYGRDRRWGIELWGQNLFNKRYYQIGADMPLQGSGSFRSVAAPAALGFPATANQLFVGFPGEPRTYGVTLRGQF